MPLEKWRAAFEGTVGAVGAMANTVSLGQKPWVWVLILLLFRGEP